MDPRTQTAIAEVRKLFAERMPKEGVSKVAYKNLIDAIQSDADLLRMITDGAIADVVNAAAGLELIVAGLDNRVVVKGCG